MTIYNSSSYFFSNANRCGVVLTDRCLLQRMELHFVLSQLTQQDKSELKLYKAIIITFGVE